MDKETLIHQIEEMLKIEVSSNALSVILFSPQGLFNDLALLVGDRKAVAQMPLFRRASERVSELAWRESAPLRAEVDRMNAALERGKALAAKATPPDLNGPLAPSEATPSKTT
jgi:hypothetical protein